MSTYEYFSGLPEVGIVPRAPHAGPLLREVYEQELMEQVEAAEEPRSMELIARHVIPRFGGS